jgi:hypothetical protein
MYFINNYIQEYYNINKTNIIFILFGFLYFFLLLKIYIISNMLITDFNKKYVFDNNSDKIINNKINDCNNIVEDLIITINDIKKSSNNNYKNV